VFVPAPGEYVATGAARQAAWVLSAKKNPSLVAGRRFDVRGQPRPRGVRERYAEVQYMTAQRLDVKRKAEVLAPEKASPR
jgi:xylulokinase